MYVFATFGLSCALVILNELVVVPLCMFEIRANHSEFVRLKQGVTPLRKSAVQPVNYLVSLFSG